MWSNLLKSPKRSCAGSAQRISCTILTSRPLGERLAGSRNHDLSSGIDPTNSTRAPAASSPAHPRSCCSWRSTKAAEQFHCSFVAVPMKTRLPVFTIVLVTSKSHPPCLQKSCFHMLATAMHLQDVVCAEPVGRQMLMLRPCLPLALPRIRP